MNKQRNQESAATLPQLQQLVAKASTITSTKSYWGSKGPIGLRYHFKELGDALEFAEMFHRSVRWYGVNNYIVKLSKISEPQSRNLQLLAVGRVPSAQRVSFFAPSKSAATKAEAFPFYFPTGCRISMKMDSKLNDKVYSYRFGNKNEAKAFIEGVGQVLNIVPQTKKRTNFIDVLIRGEASNQKVHEYRVSEVMKPFEITIPRWQVRHKKTLELHPAVAALLTQIRKDSALDKRQTSVVTPVVNYPKKPSEITRLLIEEDSSSEDCKCCMFGK